MELLASIDGLRAAAERLGEDLDLTFEIADDAAVEQATAGLPWSAELAQAHRHGAPTGTFPRFVQDAELWTLAELAPGQIGYARGQGGTRFEEWDRSWLVIGADAGDPFIAHTDRPGTPVSVAVHGAGSWEPLLVADDLATFYALVAAWSALGIEDVVGGRLDEDDDFEVRPSFWPAFDRRLGPVLPPANLAALRSYLEV